MKIVGVQFEDSDKIFYYYVDDLKLKNHNRLLFSLYNKLDAEFYGGFNLFGKGFGNHEQDIVLSAICEVSEENQVSI